MKKIILITKTALEKIPPVISDLYILLDLGYRPSIIVTGISDGLKKDLEEKGVTVHRIQDKHRFPIIGKLWSYYRFRRFCAKTTKEYTAKSQPLLWIEGGHTILALGNSIKKYEYILQISELHERSKLQLNAIKHVIHSAKAVFMPEYNRTALYQVWFHLEKRPTVLPNKPYLLPSEEQLYKIKEKYADTLSLLQGKKVILYQGLIYPDRSPEKIVQAAKNIGEYQILFVGRATPGMMDKLLSIDDSIIHIPFLPFPDYLIFATVAHIGCAFYKSDSINNVFCAPNKINEYSAYSLPMIGNDIPGLKYLFESTGAGVVVDENNIKSIEQGLKRLESDYAYYKSNANRIYNAYDTKKIVADTLNQL